MRPDSVDVAVIGAGPAGLAAAATAAELGLSVALLDEQAHPGGQIYRDVTRAGADRLQVLGDDYAAGRALVERFRHRRRGTWAARPSGISPAIALFTT